MQLVIKPIEGRMVLDQRTLGGQRRFHGYEFGERRKRTVQGKEVLVPSAKFGDGTEETVTETRDGFYRRAILDGDIEYVATVDGEKRSREVALVLATARNKKAREEAARTAKAAVEEAKRAHELALQAADRGEELEPKVVAEKSEPAKKAKENV
jgi:hypothetical protein